VTREEHTVEARLRRPGQDGRRKELAEQRRHRGGAVGTAAGSRESTEETRVHEWMPDQRAFVGSEQIQRAHSQS